MILFLTSSPCDDNVPEGCDLPCVFFQKNGFTANLQEAVAPGMRCVLVAAAPEAYAHNNLMAQTFADCFAWDGMAFSDCAVDGFLVTSAADNRAAFKGHRVRQLSDVPCDPDALVIVAVTEGYREDVERALKFIDGRLGGRAAQALAQPLSA